MKTTDRRRWAGTAGSAAAVILTVLLCLPLLTGCGKSKKEQKKESPALAVDEGTTLYLAQAYFLKKKGPDGKMQSVPGPAHLEIYSYTGGEWHAEVLEDTESNVFHKAAWFTPVEGEPGILTIGAVEALLKIWRKKGGKWEAETLWNPTFGGKWNRLRDFEVADVTGDGLDDIIIATHDQGVIAVVSWKDGAYHPEEIFRKENTFVHEIEVGDVDGDGITEFFTTPSKPNKLDGSIQPGQVDMFKLKDGEWLHSTIDLMKTRHAKEILCVSLTGEDRPVLFSSLEGEAIGGEKAGAGTTIRLYRFEGEKATHEDIADLPGQLCRFLTFGDTDGDGVGEVIASTKSNGIWKLTPPATEGGTWSKKLIASDTAGFEHATYLYDSNGDGVDELWVASDDQEEFRRYWYNGRDYSEETLGKLVDRALTFNITATRHSTGQ